MFEKFFQQAKSAVILRYKNFLKFFHGFIGNHPEMWEKLFLEKYKKFLFFKICKFPLKIQEVF